MKKDTTKTTPESAEDLRADISRLAAAADYSRLVFVRAFLRAGADQSAQDIPGRA